MGRRRLAWGSWLVVLAIVLIAATTAGALPVATNFENPGSHDTSQQFTPGNVQRQDTPNDPNYDEAEPDGSPQTSSNIFDERFDLFGFPSALSSSARYLEGPNAGKPQISGFNAAGAWKLTRGRPDVTIAILDTGIKWDKTGLRKQIHLNKGELPKPQGCTDYDCHGNDGFNVDDYVGDSRVTPTGPGGTITGQDLIHAFSD